MAWIESHQTLRDHPKTKRLCRLLGVRLPEAIGYLHLLWWWCLDYAQDGSLLGYDAQDIADAVGWEGDAEQFVGALVRAGFLEYDGDTLVVHDWWDYAGKLVERRREHAERMRELRRRNQQPDGQQVRVTADARDDHVQRTCESRDDHVQRTCSARDGVTVTNTVTYTVTETEENNDTLLAPPADAAARKRERDDLFETLVEVCYGVPYDQVQLTRSERGRVNAALKELRAVGATADEVRKRAEAYRRRWPGVDLTPTALAANWAKLDVVHEARASPNGSAAVIDWDAARVRRARMLAAIQEILAEHEANDQGGGET